MSAPVVAALIGVGGAIVGAAIVGVVSLHVAKRGASERERTRREQNLLAAFQYFDGRTQRRSVGLSIIEASWRDMPELLPMFVPLLVNQAIYLITQSKEKEDAELEYRNLDRIVALLTKRSARPGAVDGYGALREILRKKLGGGYERGLPLKRERINKYRGRLGDEALGVTGGLREKTPER